MSETGISNREYDFLRRSELKEEVLNPKPVVFDVCKAEIGKEYKITIPNAAFVSPSAAKQMGQRTFPSRGNTTGMTLLPSGRHENTRSILDTYDLIREMQNLERPDFFLPTPQEKHELYGLIYSGDIETVKRATSARLYQIKSHLLFIAFKGFQLSSPNPETAQDRAMVGLFKVIPNLSLLSLVGSVVFFFNDLSSRKELKEFTDKAKQDLAALEQEEKLLQIVETNASAGIAPTNPTIVRSFNNPTVWGWSLVGAAAITLIIKNRA